MEGHLSIDLLWWISVVELPALATLFGLVWRNRYGTEKAIEKTHHLAEFNAAKIRESLAEYKLEVAKSYASITYLNAVEKRLTEHLLRIEKKLDRQGEN